MRKAVRTRGVASPVQREERPEDRQWVVNFLPTERSRKPRQRLGFGATPEDASNWVINDIEEYNRDCELYGVRPDKFYKVVSVEPYVDPWKR